MSIGIINIFMIKDFQLLNNKIINLISNESFAIYLIHPIILLCLSKLSITGTSINPIFGVIITSFLAIFISCILIKILKKIKPLKNFIG